MICGLSGGVDSSVAAALIHEAIGDRLTCIFVDNGLMCSGEVDVVESTDFMTADWVHIDYELLARISNRIINEVKGVNRVVYDISSKPLAIIEWE